MIDHAMCQRAALSSCSQCLQTTADSSHAICMLFLYCLTHISSVHSVMLLSEVHALQWTPLVC